uniref:Uncharacterized protein n=1 Tax=Tanacetum cinerariifolium TaxID=118510 RepID=A0A699J6E7_TANCI|nr:hypothetical protein [Tanacetum cinerariifolium]
MHSESVHEHTNHAKIKTAINASDDDQIDSSIMFGDPYVENNGGEDEHDSNAHDQYWRSIAYIDQNEETTLVDDTQGRMNEEDLFGVHDLSGDEVFVDVTTVTTARNVEVDVAATTPQISKDELTLAQTLMKIKAAKPKAKGVTIQDPFETPSLKPIAMMDADCELAAKLQEEERGGLSIEEKSKLFVELMNKRKKRFEKLRAEERRRKPPTKAQKRKQMCTYLKNMAGFTYNQLKSKSFEEVQQAFNKTIDWVNNFVAMDSKPVKDRVVESFKRSGKELEQESAKKQKLDEQVKAIVADDDTAELKRCLEIVPEDDYDVTIEATPLSSKSPTIVDYKIYREGKKLLQNHQSRWKLTKLSNFWKDIQELQQKRLRSFEEYCQGKV